MFKKCYVVIFAISMILCGYVPAENKIKTEGDKEILELTDMLEVSNWKTREGAVCSKSPLVCPTGKTAVLSHFVADRKVEGSYIGIFIDPAVTDWSGWDALEFMVLGKSSKSPFPARAVEISIGKPEDYFFDNKFTAFDKQGEWIQVSVPLTDFPEKTKEVTRVLLGSEKKKYGNNVVVDFHFGGFRLVRAKK